MSISVLKTNTFFPNDRMISFPQDNSVNPGAGSLLYVDDSIQLSTADLEANAQSGLAEVVFFSYTSLHQILSKARVYLVEDENKNMKDLVINSRVVSASIGRAGRHLELSRGAKVALRHLNTNLSDPVCVFWDFEEHSWSDRGCRVVQTNETMTICSCDHLTNFALLMRANENGAGAMGSGVFGRLDIIGSVAAAILFFLLLLILLLVSLKATHFLDIKGVSVSFSKIFYILW